MFAIHILPPNSTGGVWADVHSAQEFASITKLQFSTVAYIFAYSAHFAFGFQVRTWIQGGSIAWDRCHPCNVVCRHSLEETLLRRRGNVCTLGGGAGGADV